ncbi:MAG: carboxypeptidase regulatory-like domain-containing protein, partial [Planctomycetes bacterium]|nr:carboxypeptidase regulatory-like domain-containing protein [Planctomycetota bacterium]
MTPPALASGPRKAGLAFLLTALALGGFWFFTQGSDPQEPAGLDPSSMQALSPKGPGDTKIESGSTAASKSLLGEAPQVERKVAGTTGLVEIQVQVAMPADAPLDSSLRVIALPEKAARRLGGRKYLDALTRGEELDVPWCSAPVDAAGRATLVLDSKIESPSLILDGEFLYLKKAVPVEDQTTITMEPELGASLELTLTTPDGSIPKGEVKLAGADLSGQAMSFGTRVSPADQRFFRGLTPDLVWMVLPQLENHFSHGKLGIQLGAGERREVTLDLMFGCLIQGTVVDDAGAPMANVKVNLVNRQPWTRMAGAVEAKTDDEGRFELGRVGPGPQTVEARMDGRLNARSAELDLIDGETREGVVLTLSLGATISGTVFDADGQPAKRATVTATQGGRQRNFGPPMMGGGSREPRATTDSDGRFEITGLKAEKYTLRATKSGRTSGGDLANFRAELAGVDGGTAGLRLDLLAPLALEGRVVDDTGAPVKSFRLRGNPAVGNGPEESQSFESEDGSFRFEQLPEGRWVLSVQAEGYHQETAPTVSLPYSAGALVLTMEREGAITGQVLTPAGTPVPDAIVSASDGEGSRMWGPMRGPQTTCDEEGRFLLEGMEPGAFYLIAQAPGWADSARVQALVAPGVPTEDVSLTLRVGGSLSGIVLEADGSPMVGRQVHWGENTMGFGSRGNTRTDGAGRFSFQNVTPGEWQVSASPSFEEMGDRMQGRGGAAVMGELMEGLLTKTVQIRERENTHVELGGNPKAPVLIGGRVLYQGEPVEGAEVYAVAEGNAILQGMKSDVSKEDGTYELTVDRPGAYAISARSRGIGLEIL